MGATDAIARPWKVAEINSRIIEGEQGRAIATVWSWEGNEGAETARLIVEAVNAYDALRAFVYEVEIELNKTDQLTAVRITNIRDALVAMRQVLGE